MAKQTPAPPEAPVTMQEIVDTSAPDTLTAELHGVHLVVPANALDDAELVLNLTLAQQAAEDDDPSAIMRALPTLAQLLGESQARKLMRAAKGGRPRLSLEECMQLISDTFAAFSPNSSGSPSA